MYLYLRLTGCVIWTAAIIFLGISIYKTVRAFREDESGVRKLGGILSIIGSALIGSGLGILFHQVANLVK